MQDNQIEKLNMETLLAILDYSSDEIFVLDANRKIIFVNKACERHYGLKKEEVIGKLSDDLVSGGYWTPSIFPAILNQKSPIIVKQKTILGAELYTSAIPILNGKGELELVVTTAREMQNYKLLIKTDEKQSDEQDDVLFGSQMVTNNKKMKEIMRFAFRVAQTDSTILIQGNSGTGKGVLARHIHQMSKRKDQPFLTLNCAAIPAELIEAELFGYSSGAFTGANKEGKVGLIESVDKGTLFLDEIGELSLSLQAKLLQVIQDKTFIPVGSSVEKQVDIRIIAATNQNLVEMVRDRQFREDLFYRLNVIDIKLPNLKDRKEDIIPLTYKFLYKFNHVHQVNKIISEECLDLFTRYDWPGNIRQLQNLIERLVITSDDVITIDDLPDLMHEQIEKGDDPLPATMKEAIEQTKAKMIRYSYEKNRSSRKVAEDLGISQTQASKLIREYCAEELT